ncbi:MAG TPA: acyl-CoA dehydrogenase [Anaerolineae bacterium]|nr:acyl-CoA dehydrogenase [Anaerolineae bacterium]HOR00855.1 acyl-CoA dehydrogenase [Anaerolineae bacterium]
MDLRLSEEHEMMRKVARDFARKEVAPIAAEIDEQARFPLENVRKMGELGFLGLTVSEEYGGAGADTVAYVIAIEEIAKVCASTAVIMSVQNSLVCQGFEHFGDEAQKRGFLTRLASGQALGAFALTEPEAGCDAAAQRSTARRDGDSYILNGTKHFITSGAYADIVLVFAMTDPAAGSRGISAFIVEKGTPGFTVGREENKMGIRGSSTCELIFQDCRIPAANRLGGEGQGFRVALTLLDGGRIGIAAQAVGIAQGALEASLAYAQTRRQFGQPIANFQAIQWMLADMNTRIEAARLLTYQAALAKDAAKKGGGRYSREAAQAKLFASETAVWVADRAVQIHGGYGYMKEYAVERIYRDAKITELYEGTSEVQRMVIAGALLH